MVVAATGAATGAAARTGAGAGTGAATGAAITGAATARDCTCWIFGAGLGVLAYYFALLLAMAA